MGMTTKVSNTTINQLRTSGKEADIINEDDYAIWQQQCNEGDANSNDESEGTERFLAKIELIF